MSKSVHPKNNVEEPSICALHAARIYMSGMRKMVPNKICISETRTHTYRLLSIIYNNIAHFFIYLYTSFFTHLYISLHIFTHTHRVLSNRKYLFLKRITVAINYYKNAHYLYLQARNHSAAISATALSHRRKFCSVI